MNRDEVMTEIKKLQKEYPALALVAENNVVDAELVEPEKVR